MGGECCQGINIEKITESRSLMNTSGQSHNNYNKIKTNQCDYNIK